jgi:glucose/arabinose dehydrogenase
LRIDVEFSQTLLAFGNSLIFLPLIMNNYRAIPGDQPYAIPADNPFVGVPGYREEIWAVGLRNPWRFSFDRLNGNLFIGDVGQNAWEEVDFQPASSQGGENYGWNILEGFECYGGGNCDKTGLTLPIFVYQTDVAGCAVTGGFVYGGQTYPGMQGIYFFGDYCSGRIWGLQPDGNSWLAHEFLDTLYTFSSFGEDEAGELYLIDRGGGAIYQIVESVGNFK